MFNGNKFENVDLPWATFLARASLDGHTFVLTEFFPIKDGEIPQKSTGQRGSTILCMASSSLGAEDRSTYKTHFTPSHNSHRQKLEM